MRQSVLIVEDEKIVRISLSDALKAEGYAVIAVADGEEALSLLEEGSFSLVITDIRLPGADGIKVLHKSLTESPATPVIMMTAFGNIKDAVETMKVGAFDYITKPFDLDEMLLTVQRALEVHTITQENIRLKKELSSHYGIPNIIGDSKPMQTLYGLLDKISRTDSTILILGESGTGKELIASTIHYQSRRKDNPIIRVNCAALPDDLIESELFGYHKGAFTGASGNKPGRFELAHKGTIFLDEIGDLPPLTQTKLLRVLEEQSFEPLGATKPMSVDVRIIAATNKDLEKAVKKGSFREDLYYRLHVIPVEVPPLRKRSVDIPLLLDAFCRKFNDQMGRDVTFSPQAIEALLVYTYPGNVRELLNIVERCVALTSENSITTDDLPKHVSQSSSGKIELTALSEVTGQAERSHIIKILSITKGNRSKAAEILGISRKTLWEKINAHGLDV